MAVLDGVAVRGRDLQKGKHGHMEWEDREIVMEWDDGYTIERVRTPNDLKKEGELRGHCAGSHAYYVSKDVEFMFSLRNEFHVPRATIHCRPKDLINVDQPEDKEYFGTGERDEYGYAYGGGYKPGQKIDGLTCVYKSTYYDYSARSDNTITFEGRELCLITTGDYSCDQSEKNHVKEWIESLGGTYSSGY